MRAALRLLLLMWLCCLSVGDVDVEMKVTPSFAGKNFVIWIKSGKDKRTHQCQISKNTKTTCSFPSKPEDIESIKVISLVGPRILYYALRVRVLFDKNWIYFKTSGGKSKLAIRRRDQVNELFPPGRTPAPILITPQPTPAPPIITPQPTPAPPIITSQPTPAPPIITSQPTPAPPIITSQPTPAPPIITPQPTPVLPLKTPTPTLQPSPPSPPPPPPLSPPPAPVAPIITQQPTQAPPLKTPTPTLQPPPPSPPPPPPSPPPPSPPPPPPPSPPPPPPPNIKVDTLDTIKSTTTATSIASAVGAGPSAGSAMKLILVSGSCDLSSKKKIPGVYNPTGLVVGGSEAAGTILSNAAIIVAVTILMKLFAMILKALSPKSTAFFNASDPEGFLRFPSGPLFVLQWFYQGTCLASLILTFYPPSILGFILGIVSAVTLFMIPFLVLYSMHKGVPGLAFYADDSRSRLFNFVFGTGEWVSRFHADHWVQKHSSVMRAYKQKCVWFLFIEFESSFAMAAIAAIKTENIIQCGHVRVAQAIIFLLTLGIEAKYWPHARHRDSVTDFILIGSQCAALMFAAVAFYREETKGDLHSASSGLLAVAGFVLSAKVVVDILCEVYILITGRRRKLQQKVWEIRNVPSDDITKEPPPLTLQPEPTATVQKGTIPTEDDFNITSRDVLISSTGTSPGSLRFVKCTPGGTPDGERSYSQGRKYKQSQSIHKKSSRVSEPGISNYRSDDVEAELILNNFMSI